MTFQFNCGVLVTTSEKIVDGCWSFAQSSSYFSLLKNDLSRESIQDKWRSDTHGYAALREFQSISITNIGSNKNGGGKPPSIV